MRYLLPMDYMRNSLHYRRKGIGKKNWLYRLINPFMDTTQRKFEHRFLKLIKGSVSEEEDRPLLAEEFYRDVVKHDDLPFTIGNRAYFFYFGNVKSVAMAGDWTYWQMAAPLKRIEDTDLFYSILEFPRTARLQYKHKRVVVFILSQSRLSIPACCSGS